MRKITALQTFTFFLLIITAIFLGIFSNFILFGAIPFADFRGVVLLITGIIFIYLYSFLIYRAFLFFIPLVPGKIEPKSKQEFGAQINILFYLLIFNSLIRTHFIPVPVLRLIYLALGAKLGSNTYSAGVILDPPLTELGSDCIIGHDAVLYCHAIEGDQFLLSPIKIGNNVTIGATAVIMSGVTIEDGAIISAGAIVTKNKHIGKNEVWAGVPAKRIK